MATTPTRLMTVEEFRQLAEPAGEFDYGVVAIEFAFIGAENDVRAADIAFLKTHGWESIDPDDNLQGSPHLEIKILSPSNTAAEMYDRDQLCLQSGSIEFRTIDTIRRRLRVARGDGAALVSEVGQRMPLDAFGAGSIASAGIFSPKL